SRTVHSSIDVIALSRNHLLQSNRHRAARAPDDRAPLAFAKRRPLLLRSLENSCGPNNPPVGGAASPRPRLRQRVGGAPFSPPSAPVGDADKYSQSVRVQANTHDVICQRAVACHASETSTGPSGGSTRSVIFLRGAAEIDRAACQVPL